MPIKGFEKLSLLDFDNKVTAVIFFGGCNMRCPFCHNFDLVMMPEKCDDISFDEILSYLEKRKNILDAVTFTGGEPTLDKNLKPMLRKVKELGYVIKLDSNGLNPQIIKEVVEEGLVDFIAMDIKNSFDSYEKTCGVKANVEKLKDSINYIEKCGINYEFRTTIVDELHDEEDIKKIAEMLKGCKKYRLQKFVDQGTCLVDGLHEVSIEKANRFIEILKPYIENVGLRGYDK
ncbi:MAG: anaerobic ribonucleoside-triphosphate reductase activating protein [Bacilli bacterium]|nr:anaerobic ribonucleoside-triphosphate reductase activating protein [Bacilli bacterium]